MSQFTYGIESDLNPREFKDILVRSTLAERRPVDDFDRIKQMCKNANLIIVARKGRMLIGIARSVTDFGYCTYLSDLAVDKDYQNQGVGKKLIEETKKAAPKAKIILLSAPAAVDFYPKIGMKKHNYCFTHDEINDLV